MVNNRSQAPIQELEAAGARGASQAEIGESCDVVITMLPNSPQVKEVMLGDANNGVASHMKPGSIFIDCSSINPVASKEIAAALAEKGVEMLDAPVSGGEPKAIDGTLSFMVGGKQEIFDQCKDILSAMGASVVRCGEVGAGNTTKLANQIIVACNIQALAEALTLAESGCGPGFGLCRHQGRPGRLHGHERQGPHDDRRQRQARLQDRPAHQGSEQRPRLCPRRGRAGAYDRRGTGTSSTVPTPWARRCL